MLCSIVASIWTESSVSTRAAHGRSCFGQEDQLTFSCRQVHRHRSRETLLAYMEMTLIRERKSAHRLGVDLKVLQEGLKFEAGF